MCCVVLCSIVLLEITSYVVVITNNANICGETWLRSERNLKELEELKFNRKPGKFPESCVNQ